MKHNRKFLWFAIALIMLFSSTIPAFAAMPIDTVIVGNKAYDFEYFQNNAEAILDVQAALDAGENVYVKFDGGMLNVVINEFLENSEELPEVEYYDKDGNVTRYEAGDGDPVESEFKVIEISAIDKTIELNVAVFEAEEDAKANVEIFKLNKDGEKTTPSTLKLTNLEIKEDKVVVDASNVTLGDADYAIVVKIGDVEKEVVETIEFDAVEKLVANINKATAAQLATLLNNEDYFTGFDIAKVDAYYTAKGAVATYKTIAEVQEKVIDAADEVTAFDAFVEEINETKGVFAKYTLLKETFKFVDDANMDAYMDDNGPIFTDNAGKLEIDGAMNSFEDIQDEIDQINLDAVVDPTANGIAFASIAGSKPSELNAYKADLEALQLVNVDTQDSNDTKTKAQIIKAIDDELEAIDTAREKADTEIVKAQAALDAYVLANGKVPTEGDEPAYDNVVNEIEKLQKDDLKASELATATLEGYVTTLEGKTLDLTIFQDAKDAMSDFEAAWKAAYDEDYSTGNASYDAVKASVTTLEGDPTDSTALAALKADVNTSGSVKHLVAETEKVVIYKDALSTKDVAEMRALLFDLDVSDAYLELSSATKTEFAQYVIDELAEETTAPTDFDDLQDVVFGDQSATFGYLGDYEKLIKDVNIAGSISAMIDALEAISEDYEDLDVETQADIASIVYEHENKGSFKTIADIVAAMGL